MVKACALVAILSIFAYLIPEAVGQSPPPPLIMRPAISIDFYWVPEKPEVGERVHFRNNSTGPITRSVWDFGDGGSATYGGKTDAWHMYSKPGTYEVILTLNHMAGRARLEKTIEIVPSATNLTEPELSTSTSNSHDDYLGWLYYDPVISWVEMAIAAIAIALVGLWIGIKLVRKRRWICCVLTHF